MANDAQPYVGPRPFERADQPLFFGRDREARELKARVVAHPVTLLYAQSGAGKSSLVNARLIPDLEGDGFEVLPVARVMLPAAESEPGAGEGSNVYTQAVLKSLHANSEAEARTLVEALARLPRQNDALGEAKPLALVLDQFEELFTAYPDQWQKRRAFLEQLRDALSEIDALRVLLSMREDYVAHLDPYLDVFPSRLRVRMRLELLRETEAIRAIEGPVEETSKSYGRGVAAKIVGELMQVRTRNERNETVLVRGEFVEPVQLQVVCRSLWESLPPDLEVIDEDRLRDFGDVDQALGLFYERVLHDAVAKAKADEVELRRWFGDALITPSGTRGMVHEEDPRTAKLKPKVVELLVGSHLVRAERRHGARWFELAHDRFVKPIQDSNLRDQEARRTGDAVTQRSMTFGAVIATGVCLYLARTGVDGWPLWIGLLFSCVYGGIGAGAAASNVRKGQAAFGDEKTSIPFFVYLALAVVLAFELVQGAQWWPLAGWLGFTVLYSGMGLSGAFTRISEK